MRIDLYIGTTVESYLDNLLSNTNYNNNGDWVDTDSNGIGDDWSGARLGAGATASIVSGNGFDSNAQRYEMTTTTTSYFYGIMEGSSAVITIGETYYFTLKYRSNKELYLLDSLSATPYDSFAINTGDAIQVNGSFVATGQPTGFIRIGWYPAIAKASGDWFEVSEIYVGSTPTVDITDYKKADLYPDESIVLKRNIYNEDGLSNSNANFTKDFMLPATNNNNLAFGHYEVKSNVNAHNPAKKIEARIDVGGAYSILGSIELMGVSYKNNNPDSYSVVFYSDVSSLNSEIGNDLLEELTYDSFDFTWDASSVTDSWASGDVYIPIVSWSRWYNYGSGDASDISVEENGVLLDELRVGLGIKALMTSILLEYGYTVTYSTLIDAALTNAFVFPVKEDAKEAKAKKYKIQTKNDTTLTITNTISKILLPDEITDISESWSASSLYTVPFTGNYSWTLKYKITLTSPGSVIRVRVNTVNNTSGAVIIYKTILYVGPQTEGSTLIYAVHVNAGDILRFEWFDSDGAQTYEVDYVEIESNVIPFSPLNNVFKANDTMPEMRVADFLSGLLKAFNLVLHRTGKKTYRVSDYDDVYGSTDILDLSHHTNNQTLNYKKTDVYNTIDLSHKEGKDAPNVAFKQLTDRDYGQYFLRPDVDYSNGEFKRESIFTTFPAGYMVNYDGAVIDGNTDLQHHFQLTDDTPPKLAEANFVMMYRNTTIATNYPYYLQTGADSFTQKSTYSQYSQIQDSVSTTNSYTLAYFEENPFVGAVAGKSIFTTFFKNWMITLYDAAAFKVEMSFPAELSIYLKIKDLAKIYVNGFYHNIMSYSYDTNKQVLTLNLMKTVKPTEKI